MNSVRLLLTTLIFCAAMCSVSSQSASDFKTEEGSMTNRVLGASSGSTLWLGPGGAVDTREAATGRATPLEPLLVNPEIGAVTGYVVRVAYIIPTNRVAQSSGVANLRNAIVQYQNWYRDQMNRNGFGPRTFRFETESDGVTPKIYVVTVTNTDADLRADIWGNTIAAASVAGVPVWTPKQVWWLIPEAHLEAPDGAIVGGAALGASFGSGDDPGVAMVGSDALARFKPDFLTNDNSYAGQIIAEIGPYPLVQGVSFPGFEGTTFSSISSSVLGAGVHETSHAFGLPHDFRNDQNFNGNLMGNGLRGIRGAIYPDRYPSDYTRAAYGSALALSVSRYFNDSGSFTDNDKPTLTISPTVTSSPEKGLLQISFTASDSSGLSAAWLQLSGDLVGEMVLSGTSTTQTFTTPYYTPDQTNQYTISVFDTQGNKQTSDTFIVPDSGFNQAPQPFITISTPNAIVGQPMVFDASFSTDPDGSSTDIQVEWDLNGDGVFDTGPTTTKTLVHKFATAGDRLTCARLTDSLGAQSLSAPLAVRVEGFPPGDVNGDMHVTGADSLLINQVLVGLRSNTHPIFTAAGFSNGDVNATNGVTGADSLLINQVLVGLRSYITTEILPGSHASNQTTAVVISGVGFPTNVTPTVTIGVPVNLTLTNIVVINRELITAAVPPGGGLGTGTVNVVSSPTNGVISFGRFINQ